MKTLYSLVPALVLVLGYSASTRAQHLPQPSIQEPFEGVYRIEFDCRQTQTCTGPATIDLKLVVIGTSTPELLGTGVGWLVSVVDPKIGDIFKFLDATYLPMQSRISAITLNGSDQPGRIELVYNNEDGTFRGKLDDVRFVEPFTFTAQPIRTVSRLENRQRAALIGESSGGADLAAAVPRVLGFNRIRWVGLDGTLLLKDFGLAGFAGAVELDPRAMSDNRLNVQSGIYNDESGVLTFIIRERGHVLKIFLGRQEDGGWFGYSVSAFTGVDADFTVLPKP